jgi:hypothetical protein
MDNDLEEYTVYCNQEQILEVIKRQEVNDVFRTLILHGFDISMDEMKETYIGIARRNNADLCINIIQDTGIDSNITLYIDSSIEKSDDRLWEMQKKEMYDEIEEFINSYDSYEVFDYSDYTEEELESVENFLDILFNECGMSSLTKDKNKEDNKEKENKEEASNKILTLPSANFQNVVPKEDLNVEEDNIAYSFENNNDIVKVSCIDKDLFIIEENDYEVALNLKQMEFVVECYYKIIDYLKDNK